MLNKLIVLVIGIVYGQDSFCENGILKGNVCCMSSCGSCGGNGCSQRNGGGYGCCTSVILENNISCETNEAPCVLSSDKKPLYLDYPVQEDYIPILGYHKLTDDENNLDSVTMTTIKFREQIEYIETNMKCNWITMKDLSDYIKKRGKIPTNACVLNFDDGEISQYTKALCTLNTYQIPATYYVIVNNTEEMRGSYYLGWNDYKKLSNIGHDIQSHSLTHNNLDEMSFKQQKNELLLSKKILETYGYNVTTFSYPRGVYNTDTFEILKQSNYIMGRDTSKDNTWREPRPVTISLNDEYLWKFHYIKPEELTPKELVNKIKYTGWWQIEENYKVLYDDDGDIKISSNSKYLPTKHSFGIVAMYDRDDHIVTQFITKKLSDFTIEIIASVTTTEPGFVVIIDNKNYIPIKWIDEYTSELAIYNNFYINIENLQPGVQEMHIINTSGKKIYFDMFRIFSNINQNFYYKSNYKKCIKGEDELCRCTEPKPDPTCDNGINWDNEVCCMASCQTCGGTGCSSREGGSDGCCTSTIISNNIYCSESSAPCIINNV
jgi:peptidoglycan/xylan/chitin deacetylase (PgdA/CDA1 family)